MKSKRVLLFLKGIFFCGKSMLWQSLSSLTGFQPEKTVEMHSSNNPFSSGGVCFGWVAPGPASGKDGVKESPGCSFITTKAWMALQRGREWMGRASRRRMPSSIAKHFDLLGSVCGYIRPGKGGTLLPLFPQLFLERFLVSSWEFSALKWGRAKYTDGV